MIVPRSGPLGCASRRIDTRRITEADARLADATAAAQNEHRRRREDAAMQRPAIGTMNAATTSAYVDMIAAELSAMR